MFYKIATLTVLCICNCYLLLAQECLHRNLSKKFNYKAVITGVQKLDNTGFEKHRIILSIYEKGNDKPMQQIIINDLKNEHYLFSSVYSNCLNVRSYITGFHNNAEAPDYDFGDLVVADLNFDGKEDIAVKIDSGGNGGPFYSFYLQQEKGKFMIDNFLTSYAEHFPAYIDSKYKTLTVQTHADAFHEREKVFQYSLMKRKWNMVRNNLTK